MEEKLVVYFSALPIDDDKFRAVVNMVREHLYKNNVKECKDAK